MSKIQVGLVVVIIVFFSLGAWPISITALGALIYISKVQQPEKEKPQRTIEDLERKRNTPPGTGRSSSQAGDGEGREEGEEGLMVLAGAEPAAHKPKEPS